MALFPHDSIDLVWLGDAIGHNVQLTGGKSAQLSRLASEFRVPPGFTLTVEAYRRATEGDQLSPHTRSALAGAYHLLAEKVGVKEPCVAVRSSAIDEDGRLASFAGQHDTFLNIRSLGAVADAVERCWKSTRTETALAYRRQHSLPVDRTDLAVLVQHLVVADVSAVLFSANPINGNQNEMVITASWGLGESIVGGTVTPDSWIVRKEDLQIVDQQLGAKTHMTVSVTEGTREVPVPGMMRRQFSLSEERVRELAEMGRTLEEHMGWPVDLECAFVDGELFLLQCRPITVLGNTRPPLTASA